MSPDYQIVATLHGGKTKNAFKVYWHPKTLMVYLEKPGFISSTVINTKCMASSRNMAFNVAEAYLFDK